MIEDKIRAVVESFGARLYDIEIVKEGDYNYFRVFIQKDDGINLDLCGEISKIISPLLDVEYQSSAPYFLEVSSPGIERALKKPQHFMNSIGSNVKIKMSEGKLKGVLKEFDGEKITVQSANDSKKIPLNEIKSASTYFKW
ncbi:MAG: ribosome maturation factor RimP [Campylobacterales bacterium]